MQPLQICIGPTIRIGQESWCLPYAGFLLNALDIVNIQNIIKNNFYGGLILQKHCFCFNYCGWVSGFWYSVA